MNTTTTQSKPIKLPKVLTLAWWIAKAGKTGAGNAGHFIKATRDFLLNGPHAAIARPYFTQLDYGLTYPTPMIQALVPLLGEYEADRLLSGAIAAQKKAEGRNAWTVVLYQKVQGLNGMVDRELMAQSFRTAKEAEGYADRALVREMTSSHAVISAKTERTVIKVDRQDAMFRELTDRRPATACKPMVKVSASRLSWGVGGQYNKKYYFSRG